MDIVALKARRVFSRDHGIDWFHARFFHGTCHYADDYALGEDLTNPLRLEKNVFRMPGIAQPSLNLVLSDAVRSRIEGVPNIAFNQVVFTKLFSLPFAEGDFRHWERGREMAEIDAWIDSLPHDPSLANGLGAYHELVVPRGKDFFPDYAIDTVSVEMASGVVKRGMIVHASPDFIKEFPIYWDGALLIEGDLFRTAFAPDLDLTYFVHAVFRC